MYSFDIYTIHMMCVCVCVFVSGRAWIVVVCFMYFMLVGIQ